MRILHILDHSLPLQSGYAMRTIAILRQQRAMGWNTVHLTGPKQGRHIHAEGWQFFRTLPARSAWMRLPLWQHIWTIRCLRRRLQQVIALTRPDILHAHSPSLNAVAALGLGLPLVYEVRAFWEDAAANHGTGSEGGLRYRLSRRMETYALQRADAVTTICEGLKRDIVERGVKPSKLTVIPNAVDLEYTERDLLPDPALREKLRLGQGPVIGFIGSFYAYEGLALLVQAMPQLLRRFPNLRLLLVGGGPQEAELREHIAALGLREKVVLAGRVGHDSIRAHYALIDVLVYPRLPMRLTELVTPLKPLEAMAMGRLIAASDVGGHRELFEHGHTGYMFAAGSTGALIDALSAILAEPRRWDHLRSAARAYVVRERGWSASVARYAQVYDSALRAGRR